MHCSCIEIYRAEPTRRRECLYYLALGHYKMGNYEEARRFNGTYFLSFSAPQFLTDALASLSHCCISSIICPRITALLLDKEPTNLQAQSLAGLIDNRVTRGTPLPGTTHSEVAHHPDLVLVQTGTLAWRSSEGSQRSARSSSHPSYGEHPANDRPRPPPDLCSAFNTCP